jgi:hypothetical protein
LAEWAVREVARSPRRATCTCASTRGPAAAVSADAAPAGAGVGTPDVQRVKFTPPAGRIRVRIAGGTTDADAGGAGAGLADAPATLFPHLVNGALGAAPLTGEDAGLAALKWCSDAHHARWRCATTSTRALALQVVFPPAL